MLSVVAYYKEILWIKIDNQTRKQVNNAILLIFPSYLVQYFEQTFIFDIQTSNWSSQVLCTVSKQQYQQNNMWKNLLPALAFTLLAILNLGENVNFLSLFRYTVGIYAILMIFNEMADLNIKKGGNQLPLSNYAAIFGYISLFMGAYQTISFLEGNFYITGAFLIILATQLRIIKVLIKGNKRQNQRKNSPQEWPRLALMTAVGYCLFLAASASSIAPRYHSNETCAISTVAMSIGILLHWAAFYCSYKQESQYSSSSSAYYGRVENTFLETI